MCQHLKFEWRESRMTLFPSHAPLPSSGPRAGLEWSLENHSGQAVSAAYEVAHLTYNKIVQDAVSSQVLNLGWLHNKITWRS